jgi:hypothetical protein
MRFPIQRVCIVAALVLSLGLHWSVLQSAAWVGMMVSYSRDGSLSEALEKTFDGEHPCSLCKLVEKGAASGDSEDDSQAPSAVNKLDLALAAVERVVLPPPVAPEFGVLIQKPAQRACEPAVPPPRAS